MAGTKHKIVSVYWKYHHWAGLTHWQYREAARGHGALLLYKDSPDSGLASYPFDEEFLENVLKSLAHSDRSFTNDWKKVCDDCADKKRGPNPKKWLIARLSTLLMELKDVRAFDPRFANFRLDAYLSWMPAGDLTSKKQAAPAGNMMFDGRQKGTGHEPAALRPTKFAQDMMANDALSDFVDYNTYFDATERRLKYSVRSEDLLPWCTIPAVENGTGLPGLDYNAIVGWRIALSANTALEYKKSGQNCCKMVYDALLAGGAEKFHENWTPRLAWNPASLFNYSTALARKVRRKQRIAARNMERGDAPPGRRGAFRTVPRIAAATAMDESPFASTLWTRQEFYDASNRGMLARRYEELRSIDTLLEEISERRARLPNWHASPATFGEVVVRLMKIKVLIATIVFKRPKTKRYGALMTLLTQVLDFLDACSERIGRDADLMDGRLNLLDPRVYADVAQLQEAIRGMWRENVQSGARRMSAARGTPTYPHLKPKAGPPGGAGSSGESEEESSEESDDEESMTERLISEASGLDELAQEEEESPEPPAKPSPPTKSLAPPTPAQLAELKERLRANRTISMMPGPMAVTLAVGIANGFGFDVPPDVMADIVDELKRS